MLDILFENRIFELAFLNNWGTVADIYSSLLNEDSVDIASQYTRREKIMSRAFDVAVENYKALD